MTKYYFAYGSNLNENEMKSRCPFAKKKGISYIPNHRLVFKGFPNLSYLTIEECEGSIVPIGIYEITVVDEFNLDIYEGVPTLYSKKEIEIPYNGTIIKGITYIMNPEYSYNQPSESYFMRCLEGYKNFNLNHNYLTAALETTKQALPRILEKENNNKS